ncbi:hypothetical protein K3M35_05000 [Rhodococcus sp. DMU2021]|uniref:glycosyl hydrolase family 28-related protein n=1 Tax=Rhodococcus sp. DMU2021 TaxID=2866997 RepID=UPI001C7DB013|nr:glycosyl hydrolase family 28-related protein [Rhodococcus sp. DMU2021]MBX4168024.1 hypothetical protein [Rhodococcus sp. DMU2021]
MEAAMAKKLISLDDAQPAGSRLPAAVRTDLNATYAPVQVMNERLSLLDPRINADPTGATPVNAALQTAFDMIRDADAGSVFVPPGQYRIARTPDGTDGAGQTYGAAIWGGVFEGVGDESHLFLDPATTAAAQASRFYPIRIGTNGVATSRPLTIRNLKLTGNNAAIGGASVMGFACRHDADPLLHSDDVTVEHCTIVDTAMPIGPTKSAAHTDPTYFHRNWRALNNTIRTTSNKMIEFGHVVGGWITGNHGIDVYDGPQPIFYCQNIWVDRNYVRYRGTGINITQGSSGIWVIDNDVECLPGAANSANAPALFFRTEPSAGSNPATRNVVVRGNRFANTQAHTLRRAVQFQARDEVTSAKWERLTFSGNDFDGDVLLHDPTNPAKTTIIDVFFDQKNRFRRSVVTVPRATCAVKRVRFRDSEFDQAQTIHASDMKFSGDVFTGGVTLSASSSGIRGTVEALGAAVTDQGTENAVTAENVIGNLAPDAKLNPATMSGLVAAFDADTLTAGTLTSWAPTAGSETAALTPVSGGTPQIGEGIFGGHNAVTLSAASSQRLTTGAWGTAVPNGSLTIVAAFTPNAVGAVQNYFAGQVNALEPLISGTAAKEVMWRAKGNGSGFAVASPALATGTPTAVIVTQDGTNAKVYKDRTSANSGTAEAGSAMTGLRVGSSGSGSTPYGDMNVAYVAVFNRPLTAEESGAVMRWLADRYVLTLA